MVQPPSPIGLAAKVDSIKDDTTTIRSDTKEIKQGVGEIGKLGGIIKDPKTPANFYHNARVHELSGQFGEAFADYERYVAADQPFIDPYQSYLQLLRTQRGHEAAVEEFNKLRERFHSNSSIEFVATELLSGTAKRRALSPNSLIITRTLGRFCLKRLTSTRPSRCRIAQALMPRRSGTFYGNSYGVLSMVITSGSISTKGWQTVYCKTREGGLILKTRQMSELWLARKSSSGNTTSCGSWTARPQTCFTHLTGGNGSP